MQQVPPRPTNIEAVEACTLLNALDEKQRQALATASFMAYAERGELIWLAGAPSEFLAVVGVGFVKMSRTTPHGQDVAVELIGPGQCLGLIAAIEGRPYPLNATAVTNTWYLKIPTHTMMPFYQTSGALKDKVVRTIGPRLRKAHDMMARLSSGRVEERVAAVLMILASTYATKTDEGLQIDVPLTRQDIAEMAGTTVETAIRIMSRWQKEGLLATDHQVITLMDPDGISEAFYHA